MIHQEHGSANSAPPPRGRTSRESSGSRTKTSRMQTPALNVPAQPTCMLMIVRRSRLRSNQDVVTALLHVFGVPARACVRCRIRDGSATRGA